MSETCDVDFGDYSDDAEPVQFFDEKFVVGRKAHRCSECNREIPKGTTHRRVSYRFEGQFSSEHICPPCTEAAGEFNHRIIGGMLWEMFRDQWAEGAHLQACLNRLTTAAAKEHMRQQWLKWKEREIERAQKRTKIHADGPI